MRSIDILVGTTSGNTEYLADQIQTQLEPLGFTVHMHYEPELEQLTQENFNERIWLCCVASHGAGDYGDSMLDFEAQLIQSPPNLDGLNYAVIAIGESCYDTFCAAGRDCDERLEKAGGHRLCDRLEIDMMEDDPEAITPPWVDKFVQATQKQL